MRARVCAAQKRLRDLKSRISAQSKKNFVLERDVRYLDGRIALLIQNVSRGRGGILPKATLPPFGELGKLISDCIPLVQRMALDEREEVKEHLEDVDVDGEAEMDERRMQVRFPFQFTAQRVPCLGFAWLMMGVSAQQYSNLFFLLQSEPRHIASLCRLVSLSEIDTLLQTVMFTLYGNQYESREEHLLLTMFQVRTALDSFPIRGE